MEQQQWRTGGLQSKKTTEYKWICSEVSVNSPGNPWSQSRRRKSRLWWEGFAEKESFKPGVKSEGVMDDESGESMEVMEKVPLKELGESELELSLIHI